MSATFVAEGITLLKVCVTALVDKPELVKITTYQGENTTVFYVDVHQSDLGKVIGKYGKNAQALRNLLNGLSGRHNVRAVMEIVEDGKPER
jgi:hypothetical protein